MIEFIKRKKPDCKIIAIGNPPYQEPDGGAGGSAQPVYNIFIEKLMENPSIDEFAVVIPARWFAAGKNTLKEFRNKLVSDKRVKKLIYFQRSQDVFPTVHVGGGICILHWQRTYRGNTYFKERDFGADVDLSKFDIIPDDIRAGSIISKILERHRGKYISDIAWARKPFGLRTDYFKKNPSTQTAKKTEDNLIIGCLSKGRNIKYIRRDVVKKNASHIDRWKVIIPRAYASGARRSTLPAHQIFLLEKGLICTETYNVIHSCATKKEATSLIEFLRLNLCRYLLGVRKLTQDIPRERWAWVPFMSMDTAWTDSSLYKFFGLTRDEIDHLEKKLQEW